jgi:hypothetical protein
MVNLELGRGAPPLRPSQAPFHEWVFPDGRLWSSFFRIDAGYLLCFPDIADFILDPLGTQVQAWPASGVSHDALDLVYNNQVLPLAWSRQGRLVLHASAVEIDGRAIAFIGTSGHGKSTLAASLVMAGARFLCDDAMVLERGPRGAFVQPGQPSLRLWSDSAALVRERLAREPAVSYTSKARFAAPAGDRLPRGPCPLAGAFFLGEGKASAPQISPLTGSQALAALVRHSFMLDTEEAAQLSANFDALSKMAGLPIYHRLDYPRKYELLPHVHDALRLCIDNHASH